MKVFPYLLILLPVLSSCNTPPLDVGQQHYQHWQYTGLLFFAVIVICLPLFILYAKQQGIHFQKPNNQARGFTEKLFENSDTERKRIAADLHDGVTQELLALKSALQDRPELKANVDHIINEIRSFCRDLHPVLFEKVGLLLSLEQMAERIQHIHALQMQLDINYSESLPTNVELHVYRILQEAISNTIKYADATYASIKISEHPNTLFITIKDDGNGFNVKQQLQQGNTFGLYNILERSRACGGVADITSSPKGTKIHIQIPKNHG